MKLHYIIEGDVELDDDLVEAVRFGALANELGQELVFPPQGVTNEEYWLSGD